MTGGHDTRVSLAALIAVRPGCGPRLIFRTHRARRGDKRKGFTEPVWSNLKRSLANLVKHDINQLTALVKTRLRQMQYRPGLLEGFLAKPGLDLTPLW